MILMKDIEGEGIDFIVEKAKAICQLFGNYKLDVNKKIDFSASIGIAFYDMDGGTYEELYEAADRALYNCKHTQKGTYAFCRESGRQSQFEIKIAPAMQALLNDAVLYLTYTFGSLCPNAHTTS